MKNQEIAQALAKIGEGFISLSKAIAEAKEFQPEGKAPVPVDDSVVAEEEVVVPDIAEEVETEEEEETLAEEVTEEEIELGDLELEDLQLIAKHMKLRGYKNLEHADLVDKLTRSEENKLMLALEALGYLDAEDAVEVVREEIIKEQKIERNEILPDVPEIEEEEEPEEQEFDLEDFEEDVLKDICKELGISTRGKKQALLTRIYTVEEEQIMDALVNLELVKEEEEEVKEEKAPVKKAEKKKTTKRETMTPKRAEVYKEIPDAIKDELKKETLSYDDMFDILLQAGRADDNDTDEIIMDKYVQLVLDLTDDEGDTHDFEDPYFVNENLRCCGEDVPVKDDEGTCTHCENHYSLTEE